MVASGVPDTVKRVVHSVVPAAEIILYGSRARHSATDQSDWDILVLTPDKPSSMLKQTIRAGLYEIEWSTGEVICAIIKGKNEWDDLQGIPFYCNVLKDGIHI